MGRLTDTAHRVVHASGAHRLWRTAGRWTRASWLYRWLTAEPEPEVIVIDLRDTYTVGPFIALLDVVIEAYARAYERSRLQTVVERTTASVAAAPIRALSIVVLAAALTRLALVTLTGSPSTVVLAAHGAVVLLAIAGTQVGTSWETIRESRAYELLVAVFEPPEIEERDEVDGPD